MSDSLRSHGLQHARLPCPSLSPRVYSDSCPLSQVIPSNHLIFCCPFSSCLQSSPASGSLPVSRLFPSGGQSIGASASASILPMSFQGWFPLGLTGFISLQSKGLSRIFARTTIQSISSSGLSLLHGPTLPSVHDYWENHNFDCMDFCRQSDVCAL